MEKKDVEDIAAAVSGAIAKLNADNRDKEDTQTSNPEPQTFRCPDCDAQVKGGIAYCQSCGCELEWEE